MLVSHRRDQLIEFVKALLKHSFVLDALAESAENTWAHVEELIEEHRRDAESSRLREAVPSVGSFFTALPLARAWKRYDETYRISRRRFVSPSFNEIRGVFNVAQVLAFDEQSLQFVTFDGDCTLYSDGKNFQDLELATMIKRLLRAGVRVALVTAAGYGYDAPRYEKRLASLLQHLVDDDDDLAPRFYVVGGESNYLLQARTVFDDDDDDASSSSSRRRRRRVVLEPRAEAWSAVVQFDEAQVRTLLDVAEQSLRDTVADVKMDARVVRKPRAVGLIPQNARRELLDEAVLRAQDALKNLREPPYCAFNGGSDVWVDVGNKRVGVTGLQRLLDVQPANSLHVGDQFLNTGNDYAARAASCCLWITDPTETKAILSDVLDVLEHRNPRGLPTSPNSKAPPRLFPPLLDDDDDDDG